MGGCVSQPDRAGKERSDEIDRVLEEDNKKFKRDCKILLLGESTGTALQAPLTPVQAPASRARPRSSSR